MKVVHFIESIAARMGGPSRSVVGLCEHLGRVGLDVALCTVSDHKQNGEVVSVDERQVKLRMAALPWLAPKSTFLSSGLWSLIEKEVGSAQIVHSHGLWDPVNRAGPKACRNSATPYVISPRGMLDPPSLLQSSWKKVLARHLYVNRALREAACIHGTAPLEQQHIRAAGFRNPIAVVPNGIELYQYASMDRVLAKANLEERHRELQGKFIVLFLGRIHPQKGTVELIQAWSELFSRFPAWQLVLVGPDCGGHQAELEKDASARGMLDRITVAGPAYGQEKLRFLFAADLLILPSHSENFGMVVVEALAAGCPVVTTKGTPWEELHTQRCGWWVDMRVEHLAAALREAIAMPDAERREMGLRGRKLVEAKYSWPKIAAEMKAGYEWGLGQGPRPECVVL